MSAFVIATANEHKVGEMRSILAPYDVQLLPRPGGVPDVEETEDTLEGNALLKARALANATGQAAIADDTGLFVDALAGRPGVHSARYAGDDVNFDENVKKVLVELHGVDVADRRARFRTVIAVAYPSGESWWVDGVLEGTILQGPQGDGGFGYDPIFAPVEEGGRSLAELTPAEKNARSHRGHALRAFVAALESS
ncbi:MAG TPA: RdgB/HAM1 family non-canonical purine NTP pyrophosphatase [Acidimicrobiales bacterium]|nr:RdgB/HAM1 family non-canonical purine NTP pyrophosphatase [Acidimicrobiales bacterium]